jgi:hypothetical protein
LAFLLALPFLAVVPPPSFLLVVAFVGAILLLLLLLGLEKEASSFLHLHLQRG